MGSLTRTAKGLPAFFAGSNFQSFTASIADLSNIA